jgi:hypothetical protein
MAIILFLPAALAPRAVALTVSIFYFTSIKHIRVAWSTMDRTGCCCGAPCTLTFTLLAPHECQCALSLG